MRDMSFLKGRISFPTPGKIMLAPIRPAQCVLGTWITIRVYFPNQTYSDLKGS